MAEIIKTYENDDKTSPIWNVLFTLVIIHGLAYGFVKSDFDKVSTSQLLIFLFVVILGLPTVLWTQIIRKILYCEFSYVTENTFFGKNAFNVKMGEIRFEELDEIYTSWQNGADVVFQDKNGKRFAVNMAIEDPEDFINEVIERSPNLRRVDLQKLKDDFPGFNMHAKNLGSPHKKKRDYK